MDGWARVDGRSAWAASWARAERAMMAARMLSKILASARDKDLGCGWLMLMMEL